MNKACVLLAALMLGSAPAWTSAEPPTDEQIAEALKSYGEKVRGLERTDAEGRKAAAAEAAGAFNIAELSPEQIQRLDRSGIITLLGKRDAARERLSELAADTGPQGARAAMMSVGYIPREADPKERAAATLAAMKHPGFGQALKDGSTEFFMLLSPYAAAGFAGMEDDLLTGIEQHLTAELPASFFARSASLVDFLNADGLTVDAAARERVRAKLSSLIEGSLSTLAEDDKARPSLARAKTYLDGAFARGQLLNHTAPEVEVLWTNAKEPIKTLADLRGKVVVVDFWATWCGPCIGSFPEVRELVKHYEGYPVAVIGVTSPQGFHINHKAEKQEDKRIDTKGDEPKEFALMAEFVEQMEMTWPVVFTRQEVFNPDFGVRGIPHVAIIDPKGTVRYNGLHPASPMEEKTSKIDELLREAGLPTPGAEPAKASETTAEAN